MLVGPVCQALPLPHAPLLLHLRGLSLPGLRPQAPVLLVEPQPDGVCWGWGTWTSSTGGSPRMLQRPAQQGRRVSPRPRQRGRVPCTQASKVMPTAPLLCRGSKVRRHLSAGASVSSFPHPQIMEAPHTVSGAALRKTLLSCPAALASCLTPHQGPLSSRPGLPAWVPSRHCSQRGPCGHPWLLPWQERAVDASEGRGWCCPCPPTPAPTPPLGCCRSCSPLHKESG